MTTDIAKMTVEQAALLLSGIRAIHVADSEKDRAALERMLTTQVARKGWVLKVAI